MTMNTRRRQRKANGSASSASGRSSKPGRKRAVDTDEEEMQNITVRLPKSFVGDLKLAVAYGDTTISAFIYQQCVDAVTDSLDELTKNYQERKRK